MDGKEEKGKKDCFLFPPAKKAKGSKTRFPLSLSQYSRVREEVKRWQAEEEEIPKQQACRPWLLPHVQRLVGRNGYLPNMARVSSGCAGLGLPGHVRAYWDTKTGTCTHMLSLSFPFFGLFVILLLQRPVWISVKHLKSLAHSEHWPNAGLVTRGTAFLLGGEVDYGDNMFT